MQLVIIVALIFSFIPFKLHPFAEKLFLLHRNGIQPEREMSFYRLFVVVAVICFAGALYMFRRKIANEQLSGKILSLTALDSFWIFVQVFAVFKIFVTGNPDWARFLLYAAIAGAVITRIFWTEIKTWTPKVYQWLINAAQTKWAKRLFDVGICVFITLIIFVPDLTKVLARVFVRDQFYHLDSFIMAPGWARLNGLVLNKDVISEYSVFMPMVFSKIAQALGGFDYRHVIASLILISILYFTGFYFFLRRWLGSSLTAAFGVLLAIKLHMFHWGVAPLIWQFPSATVVRYIFDLPVLWLLWRHCLSGRSQNLWIAGGLCGIALVYMLDTGIYLWFAFVMYLVFHLLLSESGARSLKNFKTVLSVLGLGFLPFVVGGIILFLVQGPCVLTAQYWQNAFEFSGLFLKGWGALPMYDGLKERQFFAFIMGFIIPVFYVFSMILIGALTLLRQMDRKNFFAVIICIYGLGLYHYFINRSAVSSYYVVCIPFVALICFWLHQLFSSFGEAGAKILKTAALFVMVSALMSSYFFTYYPNYFNLAGDKPWQEEVQFYKQEVDVSKDAALITVLTSENQRVALISSFETKFLMEAKRKPFFYYFPLIESTHMRLENFRGTYLHTKARLQKTIDQLDEQKPEYVFVEQKLFKRLLPAQYYEAYPTLNTLMKYLEAHYQPAQDGQYLMALKRKEN